MGFCLVSVTLCDETFGLVATEAIACGIPVVAYASGAIPEVLATSPYGQIIPKGDYTAMADYIIKNVYLFRKCDKLKGYLYISKNYNIRTTVAKVEQAYLDYI